MTLAEQSMREAAQLEAVDAYRAFNTKCLPAFLLHRARYEDALTEARAMTKSEYAQARTVGFALATQALIGLNRVPEAQLELVNAEQALGEIPVVTAGIAPKRSVVQVWVDAARGELLLATGKTEEANTT
jgi:hypothetical protein